MFIIRTILFHAPARKSPLKFRPAISIKMDQYHHLSETLDYSGNMLSSAHHLMNQHQLQATHQASQQPQYTQLHASTQHRNLNNSVMNNLNSGNVPLMNGQKSNGTSNGQVNSGSANLNGNHNNGNHNTNHGHNGSAHSANHNGNHNSAHNSINGNASNSSHGGVNGGGQAGNIVHHQNQNAQQAHLNQQLMQLGGQAASSPPQHQSPAIQHAQMSHDHLHSLENRLDNSPQLTNLTNSNGNGQQQAETKYTPPNQSMKRKLDDYLEPQMTGDGLLNEGWYSFICDAFICDIWFVFPCTNQTSLLSGESPMKKMAQSNLKKTKGRVKIKMEFIDNKLRRYTTFSKRKTGIMKKVRNFLSNKFISRRWFVITTSYLRLLVKKRSKGQCGSVLRASERSISL